jgi:hypothetical protein
MEIVMTRKLFLLFALATLIPAQAFARGAGYSRGAAADGTTTAGQTCGGCHGTASASVTTTVTGPATMLPGATETFTASISPAAGVGAGIGVALIGLAGSTLGVIDSNTKILNSGTSSTRPIALDNLTHVDGYSSAPGGNIGDWSYNFSVTAPLSLGTIVINAVMLAFNGDETDSALDLWDPVQFSVQVVPELSTVVLLGSGIAGLAAIGRRRTPRSES